MSDQTTPAPDAVSRHAARRALALLLVINLFNYIDRYILAAVLPRIREDLLPDLEVGSKATNTKLGALTTAFLVSYMLTAPLFGWLGDRTRRWVIIGVGVVLWSLASGASGLATTYLALLVTRCFVGIGEAAYGPTAPSVIADLFPVSRRGRVLAWFYLAIPVGSAMGYALGGFFEHHFDWRAAFKAVVLPGLLVGAWCLFKKDPPRGMSDAAGRTDRRARWSDYVTLWRTPSFVLNSIGMTAMTFAIGGLSVWMPDYIYSTVRAQDLRRGVEPAPDLLAHVNFVFSAIIAASGLGATLLGGYLADALRPRLGGSYFLVSAWGMLLGFPLLVAALFVDFPTAWFLIAPGVFCLFLNTGPTNTILVNVTHPSVRSAAFALNILLIHVLGDAVSPVVIGAVSDATGSMRIGLSSVSVAVLLAAVAWLLGSRHLQRDTELAPTRLG